MTLINSNSFQIKISVKLLGLSFLILGLSACVNDDVSDLRQYIKKVKSKPKETIQGLPAIKVVEPFIFNPERLRNPFRPVEKKIEDGFSDIAPGSGVRPNTTRRKEELETYSLDTLRMVGTLNMNKEIWALIKARDGTIHRVKKGNYMGTNYGEIIRIIEDRVELMEIVPDKPGTWREQQASLVLAE